MSFQCIYLHLFQWSLSSSWAVFIRLPPSPHQTPAGTGGISHKLSPAWTWSQRQPSVAVYVRLFNHLMVSRMRLAVPSRTLTLFDPFPRNHCPTQLQVSLPAQLWVPVLPADSQPTWPQVPFSSLWCWPYCLTHHIYASIATSCFNSLALGFLW